MAEWTNDDGLRVKFGIDEAVERNIGAYNVYGPNHELEILVKASELPSVADGVTPVNYNFAIPGGAVIKSVEVRRPTTAFAGTGAIFNLGITPTGDAPTADPDYLIAGATLAELNAGGDAETIEFAGAGLTASPAVPLSGGVNLTWQVTTAALTAGETSIFIKWYVPLVDDDTLVWDKDA